MDAYTAYAVVNKGHENEQREIISMTDIKDLAEKRIRQAIASGFDYGYIKQGTTVIKSYNESSFIKHE